MSDIVQQYSDKARTQEQYPITLEKCVYDDNGNRLDNTIQGINDSLFNKNKIIHTYIGDRITLDTRKVIAETDVEAGWYIIGADISFKSNVQLDTRRTVYIANTPSDTHGTEIIDIFDERWHTIKNVIFAFFSSPQKIYIIANSSSTDDVIQGIAIYTNKL